MSKSTYQPMIQHLHPFYNFDCPWDGHQQASDAIGPIDRYTFGAVRLRLLRRAAHRMHHDTLRPARFGDDQVVLCGAAPRRLTCWSGLREGAGQRRNGPSCGAGRALGVEWRARRDSNATPTVGARLTDHGGGVTKSCSPGLWAGGPGRGLWLSCAVPSSAAKALGWGRGTAKRAARQAAPAVPRQSQRRRTWSPRRDAAAAVEKSSRLMLARCPTP
jgi:hypothetical protein